MKKIRFILAIWICKALILASKLTNKQGSSTPGSIALKIYPDILKILASRINCPIIAVCGTNGKTTVNNLIASFLENSGQAIICNRVGANMVSGVTTAFIDSSGVFGTISADFACLEIDEASSVKVFKHLSPDIMIITNLFRDQLDRYGEVDLTANYLKTALEMAPDTTLIVNADDPICYAIAKSYKGKTFTFGINEASSINMDEVRDGQFCPFCGERLQYDYYIYGQLGKFNCPSCDYSRKKADLEASKIETKEGLSFLVNNSANIKTPQIGLYNVYNILAMMSALTLLNINMDSINNVLANYKTQIGRIQTFNIMGKKVILNLSKNPTGFNQGIATLLCDQNNKDIIVMINDNAQDGRDISWIWDVDFEKLKDESVKNIGITGIRKLDVDVRFKYTEINKPSAVYGNLKQAVTDMIKKDGQILYILVNYTAIFEANEVLTSLEKTLLSKSTER